MASLYHVLHITRQDLLSRLDDLDLTSNNIANLNTIGYKRSRANFQELLESTTKSGSWIAATQVFATQGAIKQTGRSLDLAIDGDGFFAVRLPDGRIGYTRDGQFNLDTQGRLVTASGYALIWEGQIPPNTTAVEIQPDGSVRVQQGQTWNTVGRIGLSRFINPSALLEYGNNIWLETPASGVAQNGAAGTGRFGRILSGALEQSNVNLAEEMAHLIGLQRNFQMSVRAFQQTDQMIALAIHMRKG
jgi:flagellar basal-body rod protein FlgG